MRKLEADIKPLLDSNAELSENSGMLQAEKKLLEDDVKRLKARTQVSGPHCSCMNFCTLDETCRILNTSMLG